MCVGSRSTVFLAPRPARSDAIGFACDYRASDFWLCLLNWKPARSANPCIVLAKLIQTSPKYLWIPVNEDYWVVRAYRYIRFEELAWSVRHHRAGGLANQDLEEETSNPANPRTLEGKQHSTNAHVLRKLLKKEEGGWRHHTLDASKFRYESFDKEVVEVRPFIYDWRRVLEVNQMVLPPMPLCSK